MAASVQAPIAPPERPPFRIHSERVEKLAARLELANDPETRATALELVQSVVELHGAALQHLIDKCLELPDGERMLDHVLQDDLVSSVFLLHSLHPDDLETRVQRGIDAVRPYLQSHGGNCELDRIEDSVVHLQLHGTCGSCPSSSITLKNAVEDAIYQTAPDIKAIVAENAAAQSHAPNLVVLK